MRNNLEKSVDISNSRYRLHSLSLSRHNTAYLPFDHSDRAQSAHAPADTGFFNHSRNVVHVLVRVELFLIQPGAAAGAGDDALFSQLALDRAAARRLDRGRARQAAP